MPVAFRRVVHPLAAGAFALAAFAFAGKTAAQVPTSARAAAYLEAALDTIQAVTMEGNAIPWAAVRDSARSIALGAQEPRDTHGAIDWALRRANAHSFLQAARPSVVTRRVAERLGYVRVPSRGGVGQTLADSLHAGVAALGAEGVCGWIVDLRSNGGGNMWPMIAGVGPLMADSVVGAFGSNADADRWFYRRGVSGVMGPDGAIDTVTIVGGEPYEPARHLPVAVLFDRGTGSSGEALAVAFMGRPNTRSFGEPTAGFATVNRGSRLPDGANMVVTTGYYADRTGRAYGATLQPNVRVDAPFSAWPFPTDQVAAVAAAWLGGRPACR
jgi:C-terminal processing protease CtpA/Prc